MTAQIWGKNQTLDIIFIIKKIILCNNISGTLFLSLQAAVHENVSVENKTCAIYRYEAMAVRKSPPGSL